jgi:hypothetical protein
VLRATDPAPPADTDSGEATDENAAEGAEPVDGANQPE